MSPATPSPATPSPTTPSPTTRSHNTRGPTLLHSTQVVLGAAALLTALVVQLTVLSRLGLPGATPDLVLVAVVGLALRGGPDAGLAAGAAAGLATDLVPPADAAIGRWMLVLGLVGYAAGRAGERGLRSPLASVALVAGSAGASVLLYAATGLLFDDLHAPVGVVIRLVASQVLYAVFLSPLVVHGGGRRR